MSDFQPLRRSLQIAAVAALLVLVAGVVFALTQQGRYKAETSLIVLPASTLDAQSQASFLETLSRGQVTATMAEVAQSGRFETEAEKALGLSASEAEDTTVTVTVVPSTSVLLIDAEASSPEVAEQLADRTAALSAAYLQSMIKPYTASQVRPAEGTAYAAGTATWIVLAGTVIAALAVALAVQQAAYQVLQARRAKRRPLRRPAFTAAGTPAVAAPAGPAGTAVAPMVVPPSVATPTVTSPTVPGTVHTAAQQTAAAHSAVSRPTAKGTAKPITNGFGGEKKNEKTPAESGTKTGSTKTESAAANESDTTNERVLFS
ncbi:hypothetical protein [Cryptosporangium phraense]|uniref:Polysaccharide chain length determinant N-terminal domain-containing protein n=1 Tax=Cryptosporangium phraense TaxID=2593070 RepID=A0A545AJ23_9ACTN|nr:hypothetical protein [Cryptosporangium phraense]TQS41326.1 hypothetical protein FL583_29895 [Cryptosporangium phraense]